MRSYLIDEISPGDINKIAEFLKKNVISSSIEKLFWLPLPKELLTQEQLNHKECQPHICAMELGSSWLKIELFVRSSKHMKCTCCSYCTAEQRNFVMEYVNRIIEELGVRT